MLELLLIVGEVEGGGFTLKLHIAALRSDRVWKQAGEAKVTRFEIPS